MNAREMTPERLVEVRDELLTRGELGYDERREMFSHVDAVTADRDEARQEVAALRAQRDEIHEAHRVEVAAVEAKLAALVEAAPEGWKPPDIEGELHRLLGREERLP